jgi:hypothetical protein
MAIHDLCYLALAVLCILLPLLYYVFYRHVLPTFSFIWLQVGGFFLMHCDDRQRMAPLWLSIKKTKGLRTRFYVLCCLLQVGGFFFMHRDDMQRVAPLWLSTTEEVREDPEVGGAGV